MHSYNKDAKGSMRSGQGTEKSAEVGKVQEAEAARDERSGDTVHLERTHCEFSAGTLKGMKRRGLGIQ